MDKIKNVAQRLGIITVEEMERYTALELMLAIANKVNELIVDVERFESDVDDVVKSQNEKIQYLLDEGLLLEVTAIFDGWVEDGTFDRLINQTGLKKVNERIDETNAQLSKINNEKLDKSGIVTMANMGQDVREAMSGGSVAVVGNNAVLQQNIVAKQITHDKLADNVLKFKDVNLITDVREGYFINWDNGELQKSDSYCYSNFVSVNGYTTLYARGNYHLAFYDNNLTFISGNQGAPDRVQVTTINVPTNAIFTRFSTQLVHKDDFVVCTSSEFANNHKKLIVRKTTESGEEIELDDNFIKTNHLSDKSVTKDKVDDLIVKCSVGKNKYYPKDKGYFVNWGIDGLVASELYDTSDYIKVNVGDVINQTINSHYCIYDINYHRVDGNRDTDTPSPLIIPENGAYIRVSPKKSYDNYMLTINEELGDYEPYKLTLDDINGVPVPIANLDKYEKSRFYGKKVSWYGTSVTQGYAWCQLVNQTFNFKATNNGVGGTAICKENDNSSMCTKNRMQGKYGNVVDDNTGQMTYDGVAIPSDVDVIFVEGGTNDWARNWEVGDKTFTETPNDQTFAGACHLMFKNMTELFPDAEIIIVGSPFGKMKDRASFTNKYGVLNNQNLQTVEYGDILLDVAGLWGIKGFNIGRVSGINDNNVSKLIPDGLHLTTAEAQQRTANAIIEYLLTLN